MESISNVAVRQYDGRTRLTSLPPLPDDRSSSSSSVVLSESYVCRHKSSDAVNDVFGDALQTESDRDTLGRNPFLDYVNFSSIIQHLRDMRVQKTSSHSHSWDSFPSATSVSLQSSPKSRHDKQPVPLPRKMRSMQELPVVAPVPRSRSGQHCGKAPSQSWSSGQLETTGHEATFETASLQCLDDTRDDLLEDVLDSGFTMDAPEIGTPDKSASTEDLLDKIEMWIPEWRKEEYLSAQKKCQAKHRKRSSHGAGSPGRLHVNLDSYVRNRGSDSDGDNSPQSPVYLDILSELTTSESPKSITSPHFSPMPLPNAALSEELASAQSSYPTHCTSPLTASSSSSPSLADRCLGPTKSLSSPSPSKHSPVARDSSPFSSIPAMPLTHPSRSLPLTTHSELSPSQDFTQRRVQAYDLFSESLECSCSHISMLEGSGSQRSSPRHKPLHDISASPTKAGSESPDGWRSDRVASSEASTGIHTHVDIEQSLFPYSRPSFDEQREDSETMSSTHVDEPLYSSITSSTCSHECALDLLPQSDDYYARPDELLTSVASGTKGLLPLGKVIDPYSHISEDQLRVLASRPPAVPPMPPSPPPRMSPEKSPDGRRAKNG